MLNVLESFEKIKKLPVAEFRIIKSEADLSKLDFPCWLKVSISGHKTEQKAVLRCKNFQDAEKNFKEMRKKFPTDTILAQEEVEGINMILGLKQDVTFGKLLLLGFGGIHAEVEKDVSFLSTPTSKDEIEKAVRSLKLYPSLVTRKKYALDKFISLALEVSKLDIKEADFNPIILNEKEALIVDSRIQI